MALIEDGKKKINEEVFSGCPPVVECAWFVVGCSNFQYTHTHIGLGRLGIPTYLFLYYIIIIITHTFGRSVV